MAAESSLTTAEQDWLRQALGSHRMGLLDHDGFAKELEAVIASRLAEKASLVAPGGMCVWCKRTTATEGGVPCQSSPICDQSVMPPGTVHRPFTDDGVTYCGWDGHEGCGEVWPCPTARLTHPIPPSQEDDA